MINALRTAHTLTCQDFLPHLGGPPTTSKPQASEVPWGRSVILDTPDPGWRHLGIPACVTSFSGLEKSGLSLCFKVSQPQTPFPPSSYSYGVGTHPGRPSDPDRGRDLPSMSLVQVPVRWGLGVLSAVICGRRQVAQ